MAHYISILCRANSEEVELLTPDDTFLSYTSDDEYFKKKYDGGDRLESILFGNKIIYLTIQSSLFILDKLNWNHITIKDFKTIFLEKNSLKNEYENINLSQESSLVKEVIKNVDFQTKDELINVHKNNSFILFRRGIQIEKEDNNFIFDTEEEEDYHDFSITSNAFLGNKLKISKLLENYGSKSEE